MYLEWHYDKRLFSVRFPQTGIESEYRELDLSGQELKVLRCNEMLQYGAGSLPPFGSCPASRSSSYFVHVNLPFR